MPTTLWPKVVPTLTPAQEAIRADFYQYWLTVLPQRYGLIERFNHGYPRRTITPGCRTLEIGAGLGAHLAYEDLTHQTYTALDLRPAHTAALQQRYPGVQTLVGDCQVAIAAPDHAYDRVLAIHVLEHLPNLPAALDEIRRVLRPGGVLSVVLPCEGGLAYTLARRLSAQRLFERRYRQPYAWFVAVEHVNRPAEILPELTARFRLTHRRFFPLRVPSVQANLVLGLTLSS